MKKLVRAVLLAGMALTVVIVIGTASKPGAKDYISYWSAAHLMGQHADPYAGQPVFAMEKSEGFDAATPLIMRNPPWALFLVYPLRYFSARIGLIFWMAAALGCVVACLKVYEVPVRDRVLAFCFAPVYACLAAGQSSAFLLLGLSLFVANYRKRPFVAGAALLLLAIKPHLFLVLWPVLLIDCLYHRRYRTLAGGAVALAVASALATWLDPQIWSRYLGMLRSSQLKEEFLQTPAYLLRHWIAPNTVWVQIVPCAVAMAWAVWFYWSRREGWDWKIDAMPLLVVTLVVSPYAWMTDEIVLLPVVLMAIAAPDRARYTSAFFMAINAVALIMLMAQVQLSSGAYVWTSTAWFGWYLYSRTERVRMNSVEYAGELVEA